MVSTSQTATTWVSGMARKLFSSPRPWVPVPMTPRVMRSLGPFRAEAAPAECSSSGAVNARECGCFEELSPIQFVCMAGDFWSCRLDGIPAEIFKGNRNPGGNGRKMDGRRI